MISLRAGALLYRQMLAGEDPYLPLLRQNVDRLQSPGRDAQMSIHYGDPARHFQMVSTTVVTQLPNAVGAAYALRNSPRVAATFFGDGGSSTGGAHVALNMAATLSSPVLFLCRTNGYAISTLCAEQFCSDGVAGRAVAGYGIAAYRVDGTDALGTFVAVREARKFVAESKKPVLVESMSLRKGNHSTFDDSSRYRKVNNLDFFPDGIERMTEFCRDTGIWKKNFILEFEEVQRKKIVELFAVAESEDAVAPKWLFEDVYKEETPSLIAQKERLLRHLNTND